MPVYLDNNATTPLEPAVREAMMRMFDVEYGNVGSRTHVFGAEAKRATQAARQEVAAVVEANSSEVVFTSGATEANNLAILGLETFGASSGRRHVITTAIEHKAVLEPIEELQARGFEATFLPVGLSGRVEPQAVAEALRPDTLLLSVMQANNETGILQPLAEIAEVLDGHPAYFHTDAVQGFGKELADLRHKRIDLISASAHKIYGPKGVGALIARRRGYDRPPLKPLMFGGGQERGLRPGTLASPLIVGFGAAARLALTTHTARDQINLQIRARALAAFSDLAPVLIGDQDHCLPHVLSLAFPGVDSEGLMLAAREVAAFSNGSACTAASYVPSHVLTAMNLPRAVVEGAVRLSWSHLSGEPDWQAIGMAVENLSLSPVRL
jgi:cysteine desulfurase